MFKGVGLSQSKNIPQAREPVARRAERAEGEERISAGKFYSVFCLAIVRSPYKAMEKCDSLFVMVKTTKTYIYGKHALEEALLNAPKSVEKVFLSESFNDQSLRALLKERGISVSQMSNNTAREVGEDATHQGIIALISVKNLVVPFKDFVDGLKVGPDTALVLLDEIQDPHNVGAIIRSSAAFGISGVLIPEHNQAQVTGVVVKVSAGMAFRVPIVSIGNVNDSIRKLKEKGFWVFGLAGEGAQPISSEKFDAPTLLVLGNESEGIRLKTRELCDGLLKIPMNPKCESLNVAAAGAVAMYAWSQKHPSALN